MPKRCPHCGKPTDRCAMSPRPVDGQRILRRIKSILETPLENRRKKFGKGWAWEITNGQDVIWQECPDLVPAMQAMLRETGPRAVGDLVVIF